MALHDLPAKKLTYEDYLLIPEDGKRHEIIDGEHYVSDAPFVRHQRVVHRLGLRLGSYVEAHPVGEILPAPTDVVLSPHDVVGACANTGCSIPSGRRRRSGSGPPQEASASGPTSPPRTC
jgi:hypothetical protein